MAIVTAVLVAALVLRIRRVAHWYAVRRFVPCLPGDAAALRFAVPFHLVAEPFLPVLLRFSPFPPFYACRLQTSS